MDQRSRRTVLKLGSAGLIAGLAGCSSLGEPTPVEADGDRLSEAELRERVEALEATIAAKNERIEALEARAETTSTAAFPSDVFEQAETTARTARDAVVIVRGPNGSGGTGWVLDAEAGYIVTNSHVVLESQSFTVETFDGDTGSATRVGYHRNMIPDVALLQTDLNGLPEFPTGDESTLGNGDPLLTVGHPSRYGDWIMSIGRYEGSQSFGDWLLSTVPTSRGNSGGPLLTLEGDVVGVVSGTTTGPDDGDDYSKSDELYTAFPAVEELTTATPIGTLLESVETWTS